MYIISEYPNTVARMVCDEHPLLVDRDLDDLELAEQQEVFCDALVRAADELRKQPLPLQIDEIKIAPDDDGVLFTSVHLVGCVPRTRGVAAHV